MMGPSGVGQTDIENQIYLLADRPSAEVLSLPYYRNLLFWNNVSIMFFFFKKISFKIIRFCGQWANLLYIEMINTKAKQTD